MKKFLIVIIFITGCSYNKNEINNNLSAISFSMDLSFEEFRNKLDRYAQNSPYPNIDD